MPIEQSLRDLLEAKAHQYERRDFIPHDPISIPHRFKKRDDIEVSALLTATIAWGNRKSILQSAQRLLETMDGAPGDFVRSHKPRDRKAFASFVHRTFNGSDAQFFLETLQDLYRVYGSLEAAFGHPVVDSGWEAIEQFRRRFFDRPHLPRHGKHLSSPARGSAAKRLNMFLRWMVRPSIRGVDFGLWTALTPAQLNCPLDVHSASVARKLGLLQRRQNDRKAVEELDRALRQLDPVDPVRYDFALFGLGVFEKF